MEKLVVVLDVFRHLPEMIDHWANVLGPWVYVLLFAIIFAETGFVFTPFLPGDSLLFAAGALTAAGGPLDLSLLLCLLLVAAVSGDLLNYTIGRKLGLLLFRNPNSKLFSRTYLQRTEAFYSRHGGKAVLLARFFPIIRTYAPFVAGLSRMPPRRYVAFNVSGATIWTWMFLLAGHFFGNLPFVKTGFQYVILAIVVISLLPALIEIIRSRVASTSD